MKAVIARLKEAAAIAAGAPVRVKIVIVLVLLYLACPIDIIPDFIPVLGQLDDILVVGFASAYIIRHVPELAAYLPKGRAK